MKTCSKETLSIYLCQHNYKYIASHLYLNLFLLMPVIGWKMDATTNPASSFTTLKRVTIYFLHAKNLEINQLLLLSDFGTKYPINFVPFQNKQLKQFIKILEDLPKEALVCGFCFCLRIIKKEEVNENLPSVKNESDFWEISVISWLTILKKKMKKKSKTSLTRTIYNVYNDNEENTRLCAKLVILITLTILVQR